MILHIVLLPRPPQGLDLHVDSGTFIPISTISPQATAQQVSGTFSGLKDILGTWQFVCYVAKLCWSAAVACRVAEKGNCHHVEDDRG